MGKAARNKRDAKPGQGGDIHQRIQSEAKAAREAVQCGLRDAEDMPAVSALMDAASLAAGQSTPTKFTFEGRPYWMRISIGMALLEVFDSPATAQPLAKAFTGSTERFGHVPGH